MMKVAIVILNGNGQQMLADYLGQVVEYSKDEAEIIVADNGSTDDSVEWVRTHFPEVRSSSWTATTALPKDTTKRWCRWTAPTMSCSTPTWR